MLASVMYASELGAKNLGFSKKGKQKAALQLY